MVSEAFLSVHHQTKKKYSFFFAIELFCYVRCCPLVGRKYILIFSCMFCFPFSNVCTRWLDDILCSTFCRCQFSSAKWTNHQSKYYSKARAFVATPTKRKHIRIFERMLAWLAMVNASIPNMCCAYKYVATTREKNSFFLFRIIFLFLFLGRLSWNVFGEHKKLVCCRAHCILCFLWIWQKDRNIPRKSEFANSDGDKAERAWKMKQTKRFASMFF